MEGGGLVTPEAQTARPLGRGSGSSPGPVGGREGIPPAAPLGDPPRLTIHAEPLQTPGAPVWSKEKLTL